MRRRMASSKWVLMLLVASVVLVHADSLEELLGDGGDGGLGDGIEDLLGDGFGGGEEDDDEDGDDEDGSFALGSARREPGHYCTYYRVKYDTKRRCMPICRWWQSCRTPSYRRRCKKTYKLIANNHPFRACCEGYGGRRCNIPLCPEKCANVNETCVAPPNKCGPACQTPCRNGGTCVFESGTNNTMCKCEEGYTGTMCETKTPCSDTNPATSCKNGGFCSGGWYDQGNDRCHCPGGFYGVFCQKIRCIPACVAGQKCDSTTGTCSAGCAPGVPCPPPVGCNPSCLNGGSCVDNKCVCATNFTGPQCGSLVP